MLTPHQIKAIQTRLPHETNFPSVVDSTMLAAWKACETKFFWSHCSNLTPSAQSADLMFGGAFARGVKIIREEVLLKGKRGDPEAFDLALCKAFDAVVNFYGQYDPPPEKEKKSWLRCIEALIYYFQVAFPICPLEGRPMDTLKIHRDMVEFSFAVPLHPKIRHPETGDPILFGGRVDAIAEYRNETLPVDEKTTEQMGAKWADQWKLRGQFPGYVWGANHHGIKCDGVLVRGVCVLSHKENSIYDSFKHAEVVVPCSPWQIQRWHEEACLTVLRMIDAWNANRFSQSFADSCSSYGGCKFMPLCDTPNPDNWVSTFEHRVWSPLEVPNDET